MIRISLFKFILCFILWAIIFSYSGYILRGIHYRQDLPRVEKIQVELRLKYAKIERKKELAGIINLLFDDSWKIIDQNMEHPVIVFIREKQ